MSAGMPMARQRRLRAVIALSLLCVLALLVLSGRPLHPPLLPCGLHFLTGLPCPLCGGTRAAHAILSGDWHRAFYLNALAFPALALIGAAAAALLVEASTARAIIPWEQVHRKASRWGPVLLVLAVGWWVPHVILALRTPKPELVDLRNPVAACLNRAMAPVHDEGK